VACAQRLTSPARATAPTTWTSRAGGISLDELSGIPGYNAACQASGQSEYDELADGGGGASFLAGRTNETRGVARMARIRELFTQHYPDMPAELSEPPCP